MESAPHYFCVETTFCVKVAAAAFRRRSQVRRLTRLHQLDTIFTIFGAFDRDKRLILQGRGLRKRL
jgi:hypothetical protein